MAHEIETPDTFGSLAELDDLQPDMQELSETDAEAVRGGLTFTFKLVAVKTVSWAHDDVAGSDASTVQEVGSTG